MTNFFNFDALTWPEVAALSRDTPLVLPLGDTYPPTPLSEVLDHPVTIGLLPDIPFGYAHSGLRVPVPIISKVVDNLVAGLQEDGFTRIYVLSPPEIELEIEADRIFLIPERTPSPLPSEYDRDKVILLPVGHTEQHGYHLPLSTDSLIIQAIGKGVSQAVPGLAASLPAFPYGVSTHRNSFAGTFSVGGRAFEDFWVAVIDDLVERGWDRFYLISGHGGNSSFLVNVVKYAGERHKRIFCATAWLYLSGPQGISALEGYRRSKIGGMGHACELETSLILHLQPDLVHMQRAVDETDFISTPSYYMDWVEGGALIANPPWDDDTKTGAYGAGSLADPENGRLWLEAAIAEKVSHIYEINEQHRRREERRNAGFGLWGQH